MSYKAATPRSLVVIRDNRTLTLMTVATKESKCQVLETEEYPTIGVAKLEMDAAVQKIQQGAAHDRSTLILNKGISQSVALAPTPTHQVEKLKKVIPLVNQLIAKCPWDVVDDSVIAIQANGKRLLVNIDTGEIH